MTKIFTLASILFTSFFTSVSFLANAQNEDQDQYTKETLPAAVNSQYLEARPLISGDGGSLFFVRRYHPDNIDGVRDYQDIYVSTFDSAQNSWTEAQNIGRVLNDKRRNAIASVNREGTEGIFFNTYKDAKRAPLARSRKTAKGWSLPTPITIQNFINVNEYADYYLSFKHNVMILAIEWDVSHGQQDLYVSFPDGFGNWKEPVNLGPVINSRESDFAPFLGSDGRSLFFSSYGHESIGGSDIFMSIRLDDTWTRWSTPVNLGPGINTNQEESYFSITDDFEYMYYTSYNARQANRDIMRIRLPEDFTAINGPVLVNLDSAAIRNIMLSGNYRVNQLGAQRNFEGISFEGWPASDEVAQADEQPAVREEQEQPAASPVASETTPSPVSEPSTGSATTAVVPAGHTARYAGFRPVDEVANLTPEAEELKRYLQQRLRDQRLLVRQEDNSVEFKIVQNLEYNFNSVYVSTDYLSRLRTIGNMLRERNNLKIQLVGHTDDVGSQETNERVARQRVENLEDYFRRRGIEKNRVEVVGAANTEPLTANDTEVNRMKNRRVEVIIALKQ